MLQGEASGQVITQGLDAITLGGMVPRRNETDVVFPGAVEGLFRGFAAEVEIDPGLDRLVDVALPAPRAPADAPDHFAAFDQQWLAPHYLLHLARKITGAHGLGQGADQA